MCAGHAEYCIYTRFLQETYDELTNLYFHIKNQAFIGGLVVGRQAIQNRGQRAIFANRTDNRSLNP